MMHSAHSVTGVPDGEGVSVKMACDPQQPHATFVTSALRSILARFIGGLPALHRGSA